MPFPKTEADLKEMGYVPQGKSACRGCGRMMLWFKTPKGKSIPLDEGTFEPHWSTCPKAADFRKPKESAE